MNASAKVGHHHYKANIERSDKVVNRLLVNHYQKDHLGAKETFYFLSFIYYWDLQNDSFLR